MNEVQSQQEFEILHRTTVKDIQLDLAEFQRKSASPPSPVVPDLLATLNHILSILSPEAALTPDAMFRAGLDAMELVDAKRFVFDNLLEGLKRGEKPSVLVDRYRGLGLLGDQKSGAKRAPLDSDADLTGDVVQGRGLLKRCGLAAAQVVANAIRSVPKFVEIEPSISFVGPVPVLGFTLKGKGMSIHELFEALKAPGRFSR
jgi:hypothetical protein